MDNAVPPAPAWKRKSIVNNSGFLAELGCHFGQQQPVRTFGYFGCSGNDFFRDPDFIHHNNKINIISLNLPGNTGKGTRLSVTTITLSAYCESAKRKTKQSAGCRAAVAGGISETIGGRSCNYGNINMYIAILNSLVTAAMRTKNAKACHFSFGGKLSQCAVHTAFNMMDNAILQVFDHGRMALEGSGRHPGKVFNSQFGCSIKNLVANQVAIPEMMMGGNGHSVLNSGI